MVVRNPWRDEVRQWTKKHFPKFHTGKCSYCPFIGKTHVHHLRYVIPHTTEDLVELCAKCHHNIHKVSHNPRKAAQSKMLVDGLTAHIALKTPQKVMPNFSERPIEVTV